MLNAVYILKMHKKSGKSMVELLNMVSRRVKYSPGCVQCDVWFNINHTECMIFETWHSRADLEKHIHSPLYKYLLAAIDMSSMEPVIRFAECDSVAGIELIQKVRMEDNNQVQ